MRWAAMLPALLMAACAGSDTGTTPSNARVSQDIDNVRASDAQDLRDIRPIIPGARLPIEGSSTETPIRR